MLSNVYLDGLLEKKGIGRSKIVAWIRNMIRHVGGDATISSDPEIIASASALILPGIGSFDRAMGKLADGPLVDAIIRFVSRGDRPLLGICLGMQLLFDSSEEGILPGLGLIPGKVKRFDFSDSPSNAPLKIPHMGWNVVHPTATDSLYFGDELEWRFYFVHSYHCVCDDPADVLATTNYGEQFTCSVRRGQIFGAQFHPEKSHRFGKAVFSNFLEHIC